MDATSFQLNVVIPADARFVEAIRDLAIHSARYAGCKGADADAYGAVVEHAVQTLVQKAPSRNIAIVFRRGDGPIEVLIESDLDLGVAHSKDPHITAGLTRDEGRVMFRVARAMPSET